MSGREATEAVWQFMPGAAPLRERYGYWPTLHDAVVRAITFGFADRELFLVLDYNDLSGNDENESISTLITLRWYGITESKLRLYSGDLYGVEFVQENGLLETHFTNYAWGMDGLIRSTGVEVTEIALSPDRSELSDTDPAHHEIRLAIR